MVFSITNISINCHGLVINYLYLWYFFIISKCTLFNQQKAPAVLNCISYQELNKTKQNSTNQQPQTKSRLTNPPENQHGQHNFIVFKDYSWSSNSSFFDTIHFIRNIYALQKFMMLCLPFLSSGSNIFPPEERCTPWQPSVKILVSINSWEPCSS